MDRLDKVKKDLMAGGSSATLQELNSLTNIGDENFYYARISTNQNHPSARDRIYPDVYLSEDESSLIWWLLTSAKVELDNDPSEEDIEDFAEMPDIREHGISYEAVTSLLNKMKP